MDNKIITAFIVFLGDKQQIFDDFDVAINYSKSEVKNSIKNGKNDLPLIIESIHITQEDFNKAVEEQDQE